MYDRGFIKLETPWIFKLFFQNIDHAMFWDSYKKKIYTVDPMSGSPSLKINGSIFPFVPHVQWIQSQKLQEENIQEI